MYWIAVNLAYLSPLLARWCQKGRFRLKRISKSLTTR